MIRVSGVLGVTELRLEIRKDESFKYIYPSLECRPYVSKFVTYVGR